LQAIGQSPRILAAGVLQAGRPPMNGALRQARGHPWLASRASFLPMAAVPAPGQSPPQAKRLADRPWRF
jgi:hypothetical protein